MKIIINIKQIFNLNYFKNIYEPIIYKDNSRHFLYNCHILNILIK